MQKALAMETTFQKQPSSKGIESTLYDPRKVDDRAINWEKINILKERLTERNNKTPFVTCVLPKCDGKKVNISYGMFQIGSPLSFHLDPVGFATNIMTNIPELSMSRFTTHELPKLPLLGIAPHGGKELENMDFTKMKKYSFLKKLNTWKTFYY